MDNKNLKSFVYKFLNKEVILYIIFGVLTTLVNLVVFTICNRAFDGTIFLNSDFLSFLFFDKPYLLSNTIAWIVAVVFAFFTNKMFVFQSKSFEIKNLLKELASFLGARVFSLIVEQIGLFILIDKVLLNELVSKIILGIVVVILNYFFSKLFIFKKSKNNS
ncbi:MAG: GtrA family protein [Clostridiales bacterium]|nr:GtrA family protein [Clostridiales bacterium]